MKHSLLLHTQIILSKLSRVIPYKKGSWPARICLRTPLGEKMRICWEDSSVIKKFPFLSIVKNKDDIISCSCPVSSIFLWRTHLSSRHKSPLWHNLYSIPGSWTILYFQSKEIYATFYLRCASVHDFNYNDDIGTSNSWYHVVLILVTWNRNSSK